MNIEILNFKGLQNLRKSFNKESIHITKVQNIKLFMHSLKLILNYMI